ncbi:MAG: class II aldolase/adducin family protein [Deltaproteobacteria bacterium]
MAVEFEHRASIRSAAEQLVEVCKLMHQRGYIAARDGNVSVRIGDKRMLVTPSGARKGFMKPDDMVLCDLDGNPVRGERGRPSSETMMHTLIYAERPEVNAVVHAHPPCAIAHTIAGVGLDQPLMPEVLCELGEIVTVPYTTPTTREVPDRLREYLTCRVALIMERHGSITLGETLGQAYDRLEILEHTARISMMANALAPGGVRGLDAQQVDKLRVFLGCGLGC